MVAGCSLTPQKESHKEGNPYLRYPDELEAVHSLILKKKTDDARMKIEDYLNKAENINWYGHAYFLNGFLYEMEENFPQAIVHYRSAIVHSHKFNSSVEAKALYNLSYVNERTQNWNDLLVNLLDLMKRRRHFDPLVANIEIPARLAATYAVLGKMQEAENFHRQASQNFERIIRKEPFTFPKEEISKALYYLGLGIYDPKTESYAQLIKKLDLGQKYFLASVEASDSEWSERSMARLLAQYDKAWEMIQSYSSEEFKNDKLAQRKQQHNAQLEMASELYDLTHRIRAEEFPLSSVNQRSKRVIDATDVWLDRLESFAQKLDLGPAMVRNKKVANKKLMNFIDKKETKVKVNKEVSSMPAPLETAEPVGVETKLPPKNIGKDPNL